eukprot:TRINITY_DN5342_c0_g1_i2.p1 TRINITY_DN5342_c0_g1~~TRINITY_DN5342_c0_g1_i2.p1  ORF type:complete len:126 (+),score=17.43 TRINITY_DN5342_c0_g1_i2:91-468(+)
MDFIEEPENDLFGFTNINQDESLLAKLADEGWSEVSLKGSWKSYGRENNDQYHLKVLKKMPLIIILTVQSSSEQMEFFVAQGSFYPKKVSQVQQHILKSTSRKTEGMIGNCTYFPTLIFPQPTVY